MGSTNEIVKSPREVWTVAVYFLAGSMTVGGGVVRCSMQVTIPLSQPGAGEVDEVGEVGWLESPTESVQAQMASTPMTAARVLTYLA